MNRDTSHCKTGNAMRQIINFHFSLTKNHWLMMSIKNIAENLPDYYGRIESKPLPFFRFMRVTIGISVILALVMILLK